MKMRLGFVSNSSSSSFVCTVSGEVFSGMDMSISEFDMSRCENNHEFCNEYLVKDSNNVGVKLQYVIRQMTKEINSEWHQENYPNDVEDTKKELELVKEMTEDEFDDWWHEDGEGYVEEYDYECPAECCPICTLAHITDKDVLAYFLHISNLTRENIVEKIQSEFQTNEQLREYAEKPLTNK
jgi:hypothetical protein